MSECACLNLGNQCSCDAFNVLRVWFLFAVFEFFHNCKKDNAEIDWYKWRLFRPHHCYVDFEQVFFVLKSVGWTSSVQDRLSWWFLRVVKGEMHPVFIGNHDVVKIVSATVPVFELLNFTSLYPGITLTTENTQSASRGQISIRLNEDSK